MKKLTNLDCVGCDSAEYNECGGCSANGDYEEARGVSEYIPPEIPPEKAPTPELREYMASEEFKEIWKSLPMRERRRLLFKRGAKKAFAEKMRTKTGVVPVSAMQTATLGGIKLSLPKITSVADLLGISINKVKETIEKIAGEKGISVTDVKKSEIDDAIKKEKIFGLPKIGVYAVGGLLVAGVIFGGLKFFKVIK